MSLMSAFRIDAGELRPMRRDASGFFRGDAFVSRVGVFPYYRDGKIVQELRPPEEVFDPESLSSMELAPITLGHPSTPRQMLTSPKEAEQRVVGVAGNPQVFENVKVKASILLTHADAISAVENGIRQISPGYTCDFDPTPGIWQGKPYDGVQRNIRYNHHAIVPLGRQGPEVGMRLDADDGISTQLTAEEGKFMQLKIGDDTHDVPDAFHAALRASIDKLQGRLDAAESIAAKSRTDAVDVPALVARRVETVLEAQKLVGDKIPLEKLVRADEDELLRTMATVLAPDVKLDGQSTDYVRGMISALKTAQTVAASATQTAQQGLVELARAAGGAPRADASDDELTKLRKKTAEEHAKAREKTLNLWRSNS